MLEFLKAPFFDVCFSFYALMILMLSMQMTLLYIINLIEHLFCGSSFSWLLYRSQTFEKSDFNLSSSFRSSACVILNANMNAKMIVFFLEKNHVLKC